MSEFVIRPYSAQDRQAVRDIAWQTAFFGNCADVYFDDQELLTDFLTLYFTDYEPGSCFVAEAGGKVVGYLIGAKSAAALNKTFQSRILFPLIAKLAATGAFFRRKNKRFLFLCFKSLLKGEFYIPDFSKNYPATLHINLSRDFRHHHAGTELMERFFSYLRGEKIKGVYLATMSPEAGEFFKKESFELLYKSTRSYFREIIGRDIVVSIYGKNLS